MPDPIDTQPREPSWADLGDLRWGDRGEKRRGDIEHVEAAFRTVRGTEGDIPGA